MPKFKYGDWVKVTAGKDAGNIGRVVENPCTDVPWVVLNDVPNTEVWGEAFAPIGVSEDDTSRTHMCAFGDWDLEPVDSTKTVLAGDVPFGGMFTTNNGGKFVRVNMVNKYVHAVVVEPLDTPTAVAAWRITPFDVNMEVTVYLF